MTGIPFGYSKPKNGDENTLTGDRRQRMIRFGTGGWRAVIGDGFTKYNLQLLAAAMSDKMAVPLQGSDAVDGRSFCGERDKDPADQPVGTYAACHVLYDET